MGKHPGLSKEVWLDIYNSRKNGVSINEISEKYSIDPKNVSRIHKTLEICDGNIDIAYLIPYRVTQRNEAYLVHWISTYFPDAKLEKVSNIKKEEKPYTNNEFVPVESKEGKPYSSMFPEGSKRIPINKGYGRGSKNTNEYNVIQHYIPDYRREINPLELSINYEYGGIKFCVDRKSGTIIFQNLNKLLSGSVDDIQLEPGEYNKTNIQEIINIGEALVGIGMFFKYQV